MRKFAASDSWRNIPITLKIPRLGNPSVSDRWSLAKIVRKVEFKLLHIKGVSSAIGRTSVDFAGAAATAMPRGFVPALSSAARSFLRAIVLLFQVPLVARN
jgi:hypothetical protein